LYRGWGGRESGSSNGAIFGHGPKPQKHGIWLLPLPPPGGGGNFGGDKKNRAACGILLMRGGVADKASLVSQFRKTADGEGQIPTPPSCTVSVRQGGKAKDFQEFAFAMMDSGWWSVEA